MIDCPTFAIFNHQNQPNVGKYAIHWTFGIRTWGWFFYGKCSKKYFICNNSLRIMGFQNWWGLEIQKNPEKKMIHTVKPSNPSFFWRAKWFLGQTMPKDWYEMSWGLPFYPGSQWVNNPFILMKWSFLNRHCSLLECLGRTQEIVINEDPIKFSTIVPKWPKELPVPKTTMGIHSLNFQGCLW